MLFYLHLTTVLILFGSATWASSGALQRQMAASRTGPPPSLGGLSSTRGSARALCFLRRAHIFGHRSFVRHSCQIAQKLKKPLKQV